MAVYCKRCATKSACCLFPSPCAPMILRETLSGIFSGVGNDDFVTILDKSVTCLLKCYDQCLGVCEKPLLNAWSWTGVTMLHNCILPRKHACLKLRDDPRNVRSGHIPLCEDTLIAQIEGRTMHFQLFILLLGSLGESINRERVLRFGNDEKSISKLSIESWVFHSHIHHFAHVHLEPASVVVVIVNTYVINGML